MNEGKRDRSPEQLVEASHAGLTSQDTEMHFTVWGKGGRALSRKKM